mmetsp:Transcript_10651/g.28488  ORF Transcript_10651/g.28488 Transcript_10651/m.28488 type:complete len:438 (+) Transcript_10651:90-1403(+)
MIQPPTAKFVAPKLVQPPGNARPAAIPPKLGGAAASGGIIQANAKPMGMSPVGGGGVRPPVTRPAVVVRPHLGGATPAQPQGGMVQLGGKSLGKLPGALPGVNPLVLAALPGALGTGKGALPGQAGGKGLAGKVSAIVGAIVGGQACGSNIVGGGKGLLGKALAPEENRADSSWDSGDWQGERRGKGKGKGKKGGKRKGKDLGPFNLKETMDDLGGMNRMSRDDSISTSYKITDMLLSLGFEAWATTAAPMEKLSLQIMIQQRFAWFSVKQRGWLMEVLIPLGIEIKDDVPPPDAGDRRGRKGGKGKRRDRRDGGGDDEGGDDEWGSGGRRGKGRGRRRRGKGGDDEDGGGGGGGCGGGRRGRRRGGKGGDDDGDRGGRKGRQRGKGRRRDDRGSWQEGDWREGKTGANTIEVTWKPPGKEEEEGEGEDDDDDEEEW